MKNIILVIFSMNVIIVAACVIETLKMVTMCVKGMNNYMMYVGMDGVYLYIVEYECDLLCVVCLFGIVYVLNVNVIFEEFMVFIVVAYLDFFVESSVSFGGKNLYLCGVFEFEFVENLNKFMIEFMNGCKEGLVVVNDKKMKKTLMRLRLLLKW